MYVIAGFVNAAACGAREPATDRGKTMAERAVPATFVPGSGSMSVGWFAGQPLGFVAVGVWPLHVAT